MLFAKVASRLRQKVCRFDVGVGGLQEFDTQDYIAALSYMKSDFGRELLCYGYWPEGSRMTRSQLERAMYLRMRDEWINREIEAVMSIGAIADGGNPAIRYGRAHSRRWPSMDGTDDLSPQLDQRYARICSTVLSEMFYAEDCHKCKGRAGWDDADGVHIECLVCLGMGKKEWTAKKRAGLVRVDRQDFKEKGWDRPYMWALRGLLLEADQGYKDAVGSEWK